MGKCASVAEGDELGERVRAFGSSDEGGVPDLLAKPAPRTRRAHDGCEGEHGGVRRWCAATILWMRRRQVSSTAVIAELGRAKQDVSTPCPLCFTVANTTQPHARSGWL